MSQDVEYWKRQVEEMKRLYQEGKVSESAVRIAERGYKQALLRERSKRKREIEAIREIRRKLKKEYQEKYPDYMISVRPHRSGGQIYFEILGWRRNEDFMVKEERGHEGTFVWDPFYRPPPPKSAGRSEPSSDIILDHPRGQPIVETESYQEFPISIREGEWGRLETGPITKGRHPHDMEGPIVHGHPKSKEEHPADRFLQLTAKGLTLETQTKALMGRYEGPIKSPTEFIIASSELQEMKAIGAMKKGNEYEAKMRFLASETAGAVGGFLGAIESLSNPKVPSLSNILFFPVAGAVGEAVGSKGAFVAGLSEAERQGKFMLRRPSYLIGNLLGEAAIAVPIGMGLRATAVAAGKVFQKVGMKVGASRLLRFGRWLEYKGVGARATVAEDFMQSGTVVKRSKMAKGTVRTAVRIREQPLTLEQLKIVEGLEPKLGGRETMLHIERGVSRRPELVRPGQATFGHGEFLIDDKELIKAIARGKGSFTKTEFYEPKLGEVFESRIGWRKEPARFLGFEVENTPPPLTEDFTLFKNVGFRGRRIRVSEQPTEILPAKSERSVEVFKKGDVIFIEERFKRFGGYALPEGELEIRWKRIGRFSEPPPKGGEPRVPERLVGRSPFKERPARPFEPLAPEEPKRTPELPEAIERQFAILEKGLKAEPRSALGVRKVIGITKASTKYSTAFGMAGRPFLEIVAYPKTARPPRPRTTQGAPTRQGPALSITPRLSLVEGLADELVLRQGPRVRHQPTQGTGPVGRTRLEEPKTKLARQGRVIRDLHDEVVRMGPVGVSLASFAGVSVPRFGTPATTVPGLYVPKEAPPTTPPRRFDFNLSAPPFPPLLGGSTGLKNKGPYGWRYFERFLKIADVDAMLGLKPEKKRKRRKGVRREK